MILVGAICVVLWGIGWAMGAPIKQRWGMIAAVFVGVIFGTSNFANRPSSADEYWRFLAGLGTLGRLRGGHLDVPERVAQAARQGAARNGDLRREYV